MELYLAPMEEITGYVFRNVLNKHFPYVDKYFTPFISPGQNKLLKTRDGREIVREHNIGMKVVPQILTNNAEHFNELAKTLIDLGYDELNLNFGCPSNTVAKKYKGSGILRDLDLLERFLDGVFEGEGKNVRISFKTRLGYSTDEYFDDVINIYNKYPASELIIHPRIQKDFYKGNPRMEWFDLAYERSRIPLVYNGDIFSVDNYKNINNAYASKVTAVMIGRGAVANPGLFRQIKTGTDITYEEIFSFIEDLYDMYCEEYGAKDGLFKLKEVWFYIQNKFNSFNIEKELKNIRKTSEPQEYRGLVQKIKTIVMT